MLKAWKRECNVDIRSISLEILANVFVTQWEHRHQTIFYYDWMVRDFFAFMLNYVNGWARPAGITEQILLGDCYLAGREPLLRMSTSLLSLCCQSALMATLATPI